MTLLVLLAVLGGILRGCWQGPSKPEAAPSPSPRVHTPAPPEAAPLPRLEAARAPLVPRPLDPRPAAPSTPARTEPLPADVASVVVRGRVRHPDRPAADTELILVPLHAGADAEEEDWDFTRDDGSYELRVPPGDYRVLLGPRAHRIAELQVPPVASLEADFLVPATMLRGRVVQDGRPRSGVLVVFRGGKPVSSRRACTDSEGRFAFCVDDVDGASLEAHAESGAARCRLGPEALEQPVRLTLLSPPAPRLLLSDLRGFPVAADLWVQPDSLPASPEHMIALPWLSTGYDGVLDLRGLAPGRYLLFGAGESRHGERLVEAYVELGAGSGAREHRPRRVFAREGGALQVQILDHDDRPRSDAILRFRRDGQPCIPSLEWMEDLPRSDRQGHIRLYDVMPGELEVHAEWRDRRSPARTVTISSGSTTRLVLAFPPVGSPSRADADPSSPRHHEGGGRR